MAEESLRDLATVHNSEGRYLSFREKRGGTYRNWVQTDNSEKNSTIPKKIKD